MNTGALGEDLDLSEKLPVSWESRGRIPRGGDPGRCSRKHLWGVGGQVGRGGSLSKVN